jgi:hypothetical protein
MDYENSFTHRRSLMDYYMVKYPLARVKFDAEVDAGYYDCYGASHNIHILITGKHWKNQYSYSEEMDAWLVVFDYDKDGGLLGIEIICKAELGDLKE